MALTADGIPFSQVTSFKYLGWIFTAMKDDWPAVVSNLQKESWKWVRLTRVMGREGAEEWTSGHIYLAVVQ